MPILEKLAVEYNGAFILAKLDTEAHPGIAQQLGIKSLPTVKLFHNRQQVDEFMGALPEGDVRKFLEKHVGAPAAADDNNSTEEPGDARVSQAMTLHEQGQYEEARSLLQQVQADEPENVEALLALGQVCVSLADLDTADSCLNALPEESRSGAQAQRLAGIIELARESDQSLSSQDLQKSLDSDPDNAATRYQLAISMALGGDVQQAMDHMLILIQKKPDYNDGAPREKLLALFNVLGDDPLVGQYRRKLFALLH
jgi:putative thioredoxin